MRAAFLTFAETEHLQVVRFLLRNGVRLEEAHDAAQEAFAEAWRLLSSTPERWQAIASERAWIRTVALRAAHRPPGQARRQPPADTWDTVPERPVPCGDPAELTVPTLDVLAALRALPDRQRLAMAFHLDDVPQHDIAQELGCGTRQVGNLITSARATLKSALAIYLPRKEDRR